MQFIDEAKIFIKSGDGGAGCCSFRREANIPKGGPDGGNGGRGGHVTFRAVPGLNTLIDFRYQQHFKAHKGEHGKGRNRHGGYGDDLVIDVPVGTQIFYEDNETLLMDFTSEGQEYMAVKGGDGGYGNTHFKSSTNQAPRRTTPGWDGQEMWVWLKLKLLSDVGLVGLPNAGKSTFLSAVSRAKPKIADYPFTTLKPQLGVAYVDESEFVIADIPGLIEGAHEGQGLGHRFLKHIERCATILHIIDGSAEDPIANYKTIRIELEKYSNILTKKQEFVAINKCDTLDGDYREALAEEFTKAHNISPLFMSAVTGEGTKDVLRALLKQVEAYHEQQTPSSQEVLA